MKLGISEILNLVNLAKTKAERLELLNKHHSNVLVQILALNFDHTVKWRLPEGPTPYKPSNQPDLYGQLYMEARRFYLFQDTPENRLEEKVVQRLWIQLLESLDKSDASVLEAMRNHDLTSIYKSVTKELVADAFNLNFPEGEETVPEVLSAKKEPKPKSPAKKPVAKSKKKYVRKSSVPKKGEKG